MQSYSTGLHAFNFHLHEIITALAREMLYLLESRPRNPPVCSARQMLQVSVLEPSSARPLARGRVKSLAAQQRTGGRVRAWVLDADGLPCALDDSPISRGLKGAVVQLETHDIASIAQSTNPTLQVSTCTQQPINVVQQRT